MQVLGMGLQPWQVEAGRVWTLGGGGTSDLSPSDFILLCIRVGEWKCPESRLCFSQSNEILFGPSQF